MTDQLIGVAIGLVGIVLFFLYARIKAEPPPNCYKHHVPMFWREMYLYPDTADVGNYVCPECEKEEFERYKLRRVQQMDKQRAEDYGEPQGD